MRPPKRLARPLEERMGADEERPAHRRRSHQSVSEQMNIRLPASSTIISSRKLSREPHNAQHSVQLSTSNGWSVEVEALDRRVRRHGVDALLAPRAVELQRGTAVELGIVKLGDGRGAHDVAVVHHHRVVVGLGDAAVAGDAFVEADLHDAVLAERVQGARLGLARLEHAQRLGDRHLEDQDLAFAQRSLRHAMARLDDRGLFGAGRGGDVGHLGERSGGWRRHWSCRRRPGRSPSAYRPGR